jgi:hypothetical protein
MANFVRDGVALDIPEAQLSLLKLSFDKADNKINELQGKLDNLEIITLDGKKYLADVSVSTKVSELTKQVDDLTNDMKIKGMKMSDQEKELGDLRMQIESLLAKEEALVKELESASATMTDSVIADRVAQRRKLERQVFPILDAQDEVLEKMSDRQLKEEVISSRYGDSVESLASRSDDAVNAMFEIAVKHSQSDSAKSKTVLPETVLTQDGVSDLEAARKEYIASIENAHKLIIGA